MTFHKCADKQHTMTEAYRRQREKEIDRDKERERERAVCIRNMFM